LAAQWPFWELAKDKHENSILAREESWHPIGDNSNTEANLKLFMNIE